MNYFKITSEGGGNIIRKHNSRVLLYTDNQITLTNDYNLSVKKWIG